MPHPRRRPLLECLESRDLPTLIFGVTTQNHLISFDSKNPGTLLSDVAITGIGGSEQMLTIDFSPHTNELVALAKNGTNYGIYILNPTTGTATSRIPNPFPAINLPTGDIGTDFDPKTGHLRLVSSDEDQSRIAIDDIPNLTSTAAINILTDVAFATGDANQGVNPNLVALTHRNNIAGAQNPTAFALDSSLDSLVRIGSPNSNPNSPDNGKLTTIGNLNVGNFTNVAGFDVADGATATAFVSLVVGSNTRSKLYTLSTTTGNANEVGDIGTAANVFVRDIAVALVGGIRFETAQLQVSESQPSAAVTVTRTLASLVPASVSFFIQQGTATLGVDFTASGDTLTFNPGETVKTITINLANDNLIEGTETFLLGLINSTNNISIFNPQNMTISILDAIPTPPSPTTPTPTPTLVPANALVKKAGQRFKVLALDGATGAVRSVLGTFGVKPRIQRVDLNGDGILDILIKFTLNGRKKKKRFDGVSLIRI